MRRILVDAARTRHSHKREGVRIPLEDALNFYEKRSGDLVALDDALNALAARDERKARVVEMRFFGGPDGAGNRRGPRRFGRHRAARLAAGQGLAAARVDEKPCRVTRAGRRSSSSTMPRWSGPRRSAPRSSARPAAGTRSCAAIWNPCWATRKAPATFSSRRSGGLGAGSGAAPLGLPGRLEAGRRRHGRGLSGRGHAPGPPRGAQGPAREVASDPALKARLIHEARAARR